MEFSKFERKLTVNDSQTLQARREDTLDIKALGLTLVEQGKIKPSSISEILTYSQLHDLRFGEAALQLGLVTQDELDESLAAQFNYPYINKNSAEISDELVAAHSPFSKKGEALRALRSQLILRWFSEGRKTLAIVSPHAGCGSSYLAANLAVIWSQMGERTLLVDADLQHGRQHELFNVKNKIGLSSVLAGRGSVESVIKPVPLFRGLSLLPAGAPPPNPGELLERRVLADIVEQVQEDYSVVLFDTSPMNNISGWEFVAAQCSDALLVMRKNKTPLSADTKMIKKLQSLNAEVVGSVLADF